MINNGSSSDFGGIYLINKPVGITSFKIIAILRKLLGIKKIGHAGTLDPFAHGLMIVAIGRDYTRMIDQYVGMDKTYLATIKLGETSTTMDTEGEKQSISDRVPTIDEINKQVMNQIQTYEQMPPNFSAKKINGVPAYKLARAGEEVQLKTKQVTIYDAQLREYNYPLLTVEYRVSSGTYIRVLAHELGGKLGTGAYCEQLGRSGIGEWKMEQGVDIQILQDLKIDRVKELLQQAKIF